MSHTLFTDEIYDGLEWTISDHKCKKFIEMWNNDIPINKIAAALSISQTQVVLMVLDFGNLGKINKRKRGLFS